MTADRIAELEAKLEAANKLAESRRLDNRECWHYKSLWEKTADELDAVKAKLAHYEQAAKDLPKEPEYTEASEYDNEDSVVARPDYDRFRDAFVTLKAECKLWMATCKKAEDDREKAEAALAEEKKLSEAISRDCNATALERNELMGKFATASAFAIHGLIKQEV